MVEIEKAKSEPLNSKIQFKRLAADILNERKADDLSTRVAAKHADIDPGTFNNIKFGHPTFYGILSRQSRSECRLQVSAIE